MTVSLSVTNNNAKFKTKLTPQERQQLLKV